MKINAKIAALAGAALLMGSVAFAADSYDGATDDYELPQGFTFYNEVSSDIVEAVGSYYNDKSNDEKYQVEFAGIGEKVGVSYTSEKFWFELAPKFMLKDNNQHWKKDTPAAYGDNISDVALNNDDLSFAWTDLDWGVRFTPFDIVDFYLNTDVYTPGAVLPIVDKKVGGNLAGDGVGIIFKPIDGLRLGLEIPFEATFGGKANYLDAEWEDVRRAEKRNVPTVADTTEPNNKNYRFRINAGVDYKLLDMITVGAFIGNIINRDARSYGVYANAGISFLNFNLGYTYNGEATQVSYLDFYNTKVVIGGHHKANLAVSAAFGDFTASLEALMNFFNKQSFYDLYAGLKVGYDLLPGKFNIALATGVAYDMGNDKGRIRYREQGEGNTNLALPMRTKKGSGSTPSSAKIKYEVAAPMVELQPSITYTTGRNTFGAKVNLQYWLDGEGSYAASAPVSWKYTF